MPSRRRPRRSTSRIYAVEDWVTLAVFWGMALCVFLQFFTRYVLNNSFAWTEEIAINCLVVVVFLGSVDVRAHCRGTSRSTCSTTICRRGVGRVSGDLRSTSSASASSPTPSWLLWRYVGDRRATSAWSTVDLPRSIVFYCVFAGFVLMLLRSIQVVVGNLPPRLFGAGAPRRIRRARGLSHAASVGAFLVLMLIGVPVAVVDGRRLAALSRSSTASRPTSSPRSA